MPGRLCSNGGTEGSSEAHRGGRPPSHTDDCGGPGGWGARVGRVGSCTRRDRPAQTCSAKDSRPQRLWTPRLLCSPLSRSLSRHPAQRWCQRCCCSLPWLASSEQPRDKRSISGNAPTLRCKRILTWIRCSKRINSCLFCCLLFE